MRSSYLKTRFFPKNLTLSCLKSDDKPNFIQKVRKYLYMSNFSPKNSGQTRG